MTPLFESSDTGAKIYLLDGDPQYLNFVTKDSNHMVALADALEMFRGFNAVWFGGIWRKLNICIAAFCGNTPKGCHVRTETCPTLTEYEGKLFDEYNSRMHRMHMAEKRAPIAPGNFGDSALEKP